MKSRYGLIGYPLGHSFSKNYFSKKFTHNSINAVYDLFQIEDISLLHDLIRNERELVGLNVTIPYKQQIIPLLDTVSDEAALMNSVNVVRIKRSDDHTILEGFNTDAPAFESELHDLTGDYKGNALILGTGGAASSVAYILKKHGWDYRFVSRNPKGPDCLHYHEITEKVMFQTRLIVNATPLGMYPDIEKFPLIPYQFVTADHFLFDLIYNPELTQFLINGKHKGATIMNGLGMLYKQAELAWEIWQKQV